MKLRQFPRFLLLISALLVASQVPASELDPVSVSPDKYSVILENEHIRVVEYRIEPGEKDNWHTHPAKLSYIVKSGTLRITTEEGESFLSEEKAGSARWFGKVGKHYGENIGDTAVQVVLVEIKNIDQKKDDLERYK